MGIVILTFTGGQLFDSYGPDATFLMMSIVNAAVAIASVLLYFRLRQSDATIEQPMRPKVARQQRN